MWLLLFFKILIVNLYITSLKIKTTFHWAKLLFSFVACLNLVITPPRVKWASILCYCTHEITFSTSPSLSYTSNDDKVANNCSVTFIKLLNLEIELPPRLAGWPADLNCWPSASSMSVRRYLHLTDCFINIGPGISAAISNVILDRTFRIPSSPSNNCGHRHTFSRCSRMQQKGRMRSVE